MEKKSVILVAVLLSGIFLCSAKENAVMIDEKWGNHFQIRYSEQGEPLTVAACAADSNRVYMYDMADRSLAVYDNNGIFQKKAILEQIGRGTYTGDDFVVRDTEAIFVNSVDKRIEYFDIGTGKHIKAIAYPKDIFKEQKSRTFRIVNRIFLEDKKIMIGNGHVVTYFSEGLSREMQSKKIESPSGKTLLLYSKKGSAFKSGKQVSWQGRTLKLPKSDYPFIGKNVILIKNALYACVVDSSGVRMVKVS